MAVRKVCAGFTASRTAPPLGITGAAWCRASWDKNVKIARPPTKHAMPTASGQILTEISGLLDVRQISGNHARLKWVDRQKFGATSP